MSDEPIRVIVQHEGGCAKLVENGCGCLVLIGILVVLAAIFGN